MKHRIHQSSLTLWVSVPVLILLLSACAPANPLLTEERQASAAATIAAARATEVAVAQIVAELTRAAVPSATPVPTEPTTPPSATPAPTETQAPPSATPSPEPTVGTTASRQITAADGGMLELSDGAQVVIPPGALMKDGEVSLSQSDALPPGGGGLDSLPHQAYEISAPSHTQEVSATVTLPYQGLPMGDALAPDAVFAASWDGRRWELLDGEVDPVKKTLSFETNQASTLSIFAAPAPDALRNMLLPPFFRSCSDWLGGSNQEYPQEPRLSQLTAGIAASNTGAPASPVYRR